MTPGVYPGTTRAEYDTIEAINQSALKLFRRSAAHVRLYLDGQGETSPAMALGTAVHMAVLEPAKFRETYVQSPRFDRRTKQGKADAEAFARLYPGVIALDPDDWQVCREIAESIRSVRLYSNLMHQKGHNEVCVVWRDESTGLSCKALLDRITVHDSVVVVPDLKTTLDASPGAFARDCVKYGYHFQAAYYLGGLSAIHGPAPRRFLFLAVEKQAPWAVACYELDSDSLAEGRRLVREYLDRYSQCVETNSWPGYPVEIAPLALPGWGYKERDDGTD